MQIKVGQPRNFAARFMQCRVEKNSRAVNETKVDTLVYYDDGQLCAISAHLG